MIAHGKIKAVALSELEKYPGNMTELKWILSHIGNLLSALLAAVLGYLAPVSGVLNVMVGAIILDLFVGIAAARKRGEGIKGELLWKTVKKLFYAVVIVAFLFAMDTEMQIIELHRFIAWMIAGFEMWSILENTAYITDHKIFRIVQNYMQDKIHEVTGVDISEGDKNGNGKESKS
jgi:hypothetical protein